MEGLGRGCIRLLIVELSTRCPNPTRAKKQRKLSNRRSERMPYPSDKSRSSSTHRHIKIGGEIANPRNG